MNNKFQPALIAGGGLAVIGIALGLVSTLMQTPGTQPSPVSGMAIGCLSCLLTVGAGAFAVYLYVQKSSAPAQTGDGAVIGLLTGLVSGVINLVVGTPLNYMLNREGFEQQLEPLRQQGFDYSPLVFVLVFGLFGLIITPIITMIGGLIGVPLFEKRKGDAGMPPPPPNFSGGSPMGGTTSGFGGTQPGAGSDIGAPPPSAGGTGGGFGTDR